MAKALTLAFVAPLITTALSPIFLGEKAGLRIGVSEVRGPQEGVFVYGDNDGEIADQSFTEFEPVDVFVAEDTDFIDAVRHGKPSPIDPYGMLLTNVVFQGVNDSSENGGREVELKVPTFD